MSEKQSFWLSGAVTIMACALIVGSLWMRPSDGLGSITSSLQASELPQASALDLSTLGLNELGLKGSFETSAAGSYREATDAPTLAQPYENYDNDDHHYKSKRKKHHKRLKPSKHREEKEHDHDND